MTGMMGALGLIAGAVLGWEPVQLHSAQHPAAFSLRAGWEGGCCNWDPLGLGPATGIGPCFVDGMETSRGSKDREERDSEGENLERMFCKALVSKGPDVHKGTTKHQPSSFSHKPARASSPITEPPMIRGAAKSQAGSKAGINKRLVINVL